MCVWQSGALFIDMAERYREDLVFEIHYLAERPPSYAPEDLEMGTGATKCRLYNPTPAIKNALKSTCSPIKSPEVSHSADFAAFDFAAQGAHMLFGADVLKDLDTSFKHGSAPIILGNQVAAYLPARQRRA
jgi:hypothetical protein